MLKELLFGESIEGEYTEEFGNDDDKEYTDNPGVEFGFSITFIQLSFLREQQPL